MVRRGDVFGFAIRYVKQSTYILNTYLGQVSTQVLLYFIMIIGFVFRCKNRTFDLNRDRVALVFEFGKSCIYTFVMRRI